MDKEKVLHQNYNLIILKHHTEHFQMSEFLDTCYILQRTERIIYIILMLQMQHSPVSFSVGWSIKATDIHWAWKRDL